MVDRDFSYKMKRYSLVTLNIYYFLPDYQSIVQEFLWQTLDLKPRYPRVKEFLDFWRRDIEAVIKEVHLADSSGVAPSKFYKIDDIFRI